MLLRTGGRSGNNAPDRDTSGSSKHERDLQQQSAVKEGPPNELIDMNYNAGRRNEGT
jgi:hypothetical protein